MIRILLFWLLTINCAWSSMESSYQEGGSFAGTLQSGSINSLKNANTIDVPGYKTSTPIEANLYQNSNLYEATNKHLSESEVGKGLIETSKKRPKFKIDPSTDLLFKVFEEKSAEERLNITDNQEGSKTEGTIEKTCEEGGEEAVYDCYESLEVEPQFALKRTTLTVDYASLIQKAGCSFVSTLNLPVLPMFQTGGVYSSILSDAYDGHPIDETSFKSNFCSFFESKDTVTGQIYNIDCENIQKIWIKGRISLDFAVIKDRNGVTCYPQEQIPLEFEHRHFTGEATEKWVSNCDSFEKMVEEGLCHYGDRICSQGPELRTINGQKIYKECWQYRRKYHCKMIKDECNALRLQGCHQIGSSCKEIRNGICWIYNQLYQCPNGNKVKHKKKAPTSEAFCLTGNCQDTSYQSNGEMLEVISRLSLLKAIQDDMRLNNDYRIFKGNDKRCSRNCVGFKDCCGGLKGWGVSMHISGCNEDEKQLAKMREQNLCHLIGTFCSNKVLGKCLSKKTSFCCFGTKLARLIQEQGRSQLNIDWGTAECPDCRGFSFEELSRLDLSKINFSEIFDEVMKKYRLPDAKAIQDNTNQKIQENLKHMDQGLKNGQNMNKKGMVDATKSHL